MSTTDTDAHDRIIAAHADQARQLERAHQTIRDLRKKLAASRDLARLEGEKHTAEMEHMKQRVSAAEGTFKDLSAQATEAWRQAALDRNAKLEAEGRLNEYPHPPPWEAGPKLSIIESGRVADSVTKSRPIMVYPAPHADAGVGGPWFAEFVSADGARVRTGGNTPTFAFSGMVDHVSRLYVGDPEPQTECGTGVDADHPVVRALMDGGFYVQAVEDDSDGLLCKVVIKLPDPRVAVPEARRAIAMLDNIHPYSSPDLGMVRDYSAAILTITSERGKALTIKAPAKG